MIFIALNKEIDRKQPVYSIMFLLKIQEVLIRKNARLCDKMII